MRADGFEHRSCHRALTEQSKGPVCGACWNHGRECVRDVLDAIGELYKLSQTNDTNR